ncbi:TPA: phage tail protein [Mannheimia haemolytica]|nr:phage tail protein [Mannheimia haemolytica]HDL5594658.1 phage tail protein [Mannheimia haemolytica]HDL5715069.1 phage tail protein [Mannheimia haemolytica]HDL6191729.1 phage tail protein [Mannheimia haemolytica]HDL6206881.1 phage tail protein [Mannheimia haemolytica]
MKIHTQIRKEILSLLEAKLTDIEHFYNGQPNFIDIDEQQLAISVYLDEINRQELTLCDEQWTAQLNITIYLKSVDEAEDELDEWAEKIREVVETYSAFEHLEGFSLSQYQYEQDQNQRTWHSATLIFDVEY